MLESPTGITNTLALDHPSGIHFNANVEALPSFDGRTEAELADAATAHPDRIERERALWELGYRRRNELAPVIRQVLRDDPDPSIRWNALWLALKVTPEDALPLIESALHDEHLEVRDWARLHLRHLTGTELPGEYSAVTYVEESPFDQTLPLQIAGFALLDIPGIGRLRVTLSPLWFEHIMGRVLACTMLDTFMRDLTIEKCLTDFHSDGSNHYEIFPFSGFSWTTAENRTHHRYESTSIRMFYPSGKVDDRSRGVVEVPVILNRAAETSGVAIKSLPPIERTISRDIARPAGDTVFRTDARQIRLLNGKVVTAVGGQFFGFAHTSIEQYGRHGRVLPGTVQLANPVHPLTASLVNTYLCGTFCGKLGDQDGDGKIDLNTIPCHGIAGGELDYRADGTMQPDPFA